MPLRGLNKIADIFDTDTDVQKIIGNRTVRVLQRMFQMFQQATSPG